MDRSSISFRVLGKYDPEQKVFVAHCLELDLVTSAASKEQAEKDMVNVIIAHVNYAYENDNLEYLYSPAPEEVWQEYFSLRVKKEFAGWVKRNGGVKKNLRRGRTASSVHPNLELCYAS